MVNIDDEELEFLIQQVWKNRCSVTGLRIGGHAPLVLSRWDVSAPATVSNLFLSTQAEATRYDESGRRAFSESTCDYISRRLEWAKLVYEDDMFGNIRSISNDGKIVIAERGDIPTMEAKRSYTEVLLTLGNGWSVFVSGAAVGFTCFYLTMKKRL